VLGANILKIADVVKTGVDPALIPAYALGVAAAAVSGYLSIRLVHLITDKGRFGAFAYYCWAVGLLTLVLTFLGL
jgi:undecaprenyl-diphosphatase